MKARIEKLYIDFERMERLKNSLDFDQSPKNRLLGQYLFEISRYQFLTDITRVKAYHEIRDLELPKEVNDLWNDYVEYIEGN